MKSCIFEEFFPKDTCVLGERGLQRHLQPPGLVHGSGCSGNTTASSPCKVIHSPRVSSRWCLEILLATSSQNRKEQLHPPVSGGQAVLRSHPDKHLTPWPVRWTAPHSSAVLCEGYKGYTPKAKYWVDIVLLWAVKSLITTLATHHLTISLLPPTKIWWEIGFKFHIVNGLNEITFSWFKDT